jgi:hypothetical protein
MTKLIKSIGIGILCTLALFGFLEFVQRGPAWAVGAVFIIIIVAFFSFLVYMTMEDK